jgi:hypothetical protein
LLVVFTVCLVVCCVAVSAAAKGLHGIPVRYIWPVGVSVSSLITLSTTIIIRKVKKRLGASRGDAPNEDTQGVSH